MRDPGISISKARSVTRDTATKVRYKGAALHTCCKSLPVGARGQRTIQNRTEIGTHSSREMNVGGHVGVTESTAVISRRDKGNAVAP